MSIKVAVQVSYLMEFYNNAKTNTIDPAELGYTPLDRTMTCIVPLFHNPKEKGK